MSSIEDTPLDELQWKSPEWVNAFGLRTDNVLEYFSQSPFFDRTSNNQVLKMQHQFSDANYTVNPYEMILKDLKKMKGIEFVIAMVREPDFWVIRKQYRYSETETQTIADFYIIGSSVYMAPSIKAILSSRLLSTTLTLRNAMRSLQGLPQFSPSKGHYYEFLTPYEKEGDTGTAEADKKESNLVENQEENEKNSSFQLPSTSASAFNNLLNLSLQKTFVYLDGMPEKAPANGKGPTSTDMTTQNSQVRSKTSQ